MHRRHLTANRSTAPTSTSSFNWRRRAPRGAITTHVPALLHSLYNVSRQRTRDTTACMGKPELSPLHHALPRPSQRKQHIRRKETKRHQSSDGLESHNKVAENRGSSIRDQRIWKVKTLQDTSSALCPEELCLEELCPEEFCLEELHLEELRVKELCLA